MKKIRDLLLVGIFVVTALLVAVSGLKVYSGFMEKKAIEEEIARQNLEEVLARNEEAQNRVQEMRSEIVEMSEDIEALQIFIEDTMAAANEVQSRKEAGSVSGNSVAVLSDSVLDNITVSGNEVISDNTTISGNDVIPGDMTVSGNFSLFGDMTVSGNLSADTVSGNSDPFGFLLGSVSGNNTETNYYDGSMTENSIFDEWRTIYEQQEMTLEDRRELRTSYEETLEVNQADREWIAENKYDFSEMKIACLGDSITAAANLEEEEDYEQYAYPARLQELLGAQEVYNLGIGGSSIGRYWADAFVDRYTEIPEDADIIIVMGGTNDGFCVSDAEFGNLDERTYRTFCGDLSELMGGLRENYPDAVIFFATPLPNILQDYLMSEREYLLPQKNFVEVIQTLAKEYDFELIDLYNSNILDSHDANIISEYLPDGVHGNQEGYQILAEHFASEIVKYYNEDMQEEANDETEENDSSDDTGLDEDTDEDDSIGTSEDADEDDSISTNEDADEDDSIDTDEDSDEDNDADIDEELDEGNDTGRIESTGKKNNERRISAVQR